MKSIDILKQKLRDKVNNKEDKILLFKILDKINECINNNKSICTNFFNLSEIDLIKQNIEYPYIYIDDKMKFIDRKVIIISNKEVKDEVELLDIINDNIAFIKITYNKFDLVKNISHRDILGSILSLGIKREYIGDIYINENYSYVIVKKEIENMVLKNINKIKNISVKLDSVNMEQIDVGILNGIEKNILVSSMRLDSIIANSLNITRNMTNEIIEEKRVYINWKNEIKKDKLIKEGDILSIRGFGRINIKESRGISKKGKIILNVEIYK